METIIKYFQNKNDIEKLQTYLEIALKYNSYSDAYCIKLMEIYMKIGRRVDAINLYTTFAKHLHEDVGIKPAKETQELYLKLLEWRNS